MYVLQHLFTPDQSHIDALKAAKDGLMACGPWGQAATARHAFEGRTGAGRPYWPTSIEIQPVFSTGEATGTAGDAGSAGHPGVWLDAPGRNFAVPQQGYMHESDDEGNLRQDPQEAYSAVSSFVGWRNFFVQATVWCAVAACLIGFLMWIKGKVTA